GLDDAIPLDHDAAPLASDVDTAPVDLDSTDRFEALSDVPDSLYPERDEDDASGPAGATDEASTSPSVPAMLDEEPPQPSPFTPLRLRERRHALDDSLDPPAAGTPDNSRAMGIGALVLALLLLGQLVHHNRESLARRAGLGPLVRSVYSGFGHPLGPNWDLAGFELRQWGSKEPAPSGRGVMTVRTSIRNGAEFAQPMPLLRVELEDRFGNAVARRDFQPTEYLKDPAQAARLLEPGGKAEADLVLVDVSDEAVGYRLDVCLPDDAGAMLCAQSAAPGAPAP
ncbi:MAG: DUF3426 domain-containing protein, partial [Steroidobacteraceae bacterium]